jgi:hypothetical protein
MLQNLEEYIETDQNIVEKSILHSLLAELYQMYFNTQQYKINRRTPITGYVPRNMAEWTGNIYREKIFQHALDAVKARPQLSEVNCLTYKEILVLGKNSPALRPTMYDFLVYRSIDILNTISRYNKQEPITNKQLLFAPVKEFVQMPIEVKKMDAYSNTLKLYQSLLQSEIAAERTDAILISDLDRLEYANNIIGLSQNDSLYIQSLEQLSQQYSKNPYKVEILYKLAQYYYQRNYISSNRDPQKALDICNNGIRQFPKYFRIDVLKQLAKEITQTTVSYSINPNVYPGHKQEVNLSFKNLSEISFSGFATAVCKLCLERIGILHICYSVSVNSLLNAKAGLHDVCVDSIKSSKHTIIHGIEAITETIVDSVKFANHSGVVESSLNIRLSSCRGCISAAVSIIAPSVVSPSEESKNE